MMVSDSVGRLKPVDLAQRVLVSGLVILPGYVERGGGIL